MRLYSGPLYWGLSPFDGLLSFLLWLPRGRLRINATRYFNAAVMGNAMSEALQQAAKDYLVRYGGDAFPNLFRSAKGTIVTDSEGREYLDFTSGQMCATIGHNHPAIVDPSIAPAPRLFTCSAA